VRVQHLSPELLQDKVAGALLGTAVGDALGLPREGLSRQRARKLFGPKPLAHRFLFGRGMISDDTEHACMVSQALLASGGDPTAFARSLAWRLRFWLLGLPAGIGLSTLRAICRLWLGFPVSRSGVRSAGNGPAMRAPLLGAVAGNELDPLARLVAISTRITHSDGRAEQGALVIAMACRYAVTRTSNQTDRNEFFQLILEQLTEDELKEALKLVEAALRDDMTAEAVAAKLALNQGVTGYVVHTVAMSIFCWLRHPGDFRAAVEEVILLGGDTDTTGAITGALAGATLGASAIPQEWLNGIVEWPRSVRWMKRLAARLSSQLLRKKEHARPLRLFWPGLLLRNVVFTIAVLCHGFRRLLPPY